MLCKFIIFVVLYSFLPCRWILPSVVQSQFMIKCEAYPSWNRPSSGTSIATHPILEHKKWNRLNYAFWKAVLIKLKLCKYPMVILEDLAKRSLFLFPRRGTVIIMAVVGPIIVSQRERSARWGRRFLVTDIRVVQILSGSVIRGRNRGRLRVYGIFYLTVSCVGGGRVGSYAGLATSS